MFKYTIILSLVASCAFATNPTTDAGYGSGIVHNPEGSPEGTRDVLFDQTFGAYSNTCTSEYIAAYSLRSIAVDDFEITDRPTIENVDIWVGWYNGGIGTAQNIDLRIYDDAAGVPTGAPEGGWIWDYPAVAADWVKTGVGNDVEIFEINIPTGDEPQVDADTVYWFGWQVEHTFPPQAGAALSSGTVWGTQMYWACAYFGYPNWTPSSSVFGESSTGFILYGTTIIDETDPTITDTYPQDADYPSGVPPDGNTAGCHWNDGDPAANSGIDVGASFFEVYLGADLYTGVLTIDDTDLFNVIVDFEADDPWGEGQTFTVETETFDNAGNSASETWNFNTGFTNIVEKSFGAIKANFK